MMSNTEEYSNIAQDVLTWHLVDELLDVPVEERFGWGAESVIPLSEYAYGHRVVW